MTRDEKLRLIEFISFSTILVLISWFVCFVINRFIYAFDTSNRYNLYRQIIDYLKNQSFDISFSIIAFSFFWFGWVSLALYIWFRKWIKRDD